MRHSQTYNYHEFRSMLLSAGMGVGLAEDIACEAGFNPPFATRDYLEQVVCTRLHQKKGNLEYFQTQQRRLEAETCDLLKARDWLRGQDD